MKWRAGRSYLIWSAGDVVAAVQSICMDVRSYFQTNMDKTSTTVGQLATVSRCKELGGVHARNVPRFNTNCR